MDFCWGSAPAQAPVAQAEVVNESGNKQDRQEHEGGPSDQFLHGNHLATMYRSRRRFVCDGRYRNPRLCVEGQEKLLIVEIAKKAAENAKDAENGGTQRTQKAQGTQRRAALLCGLRDLPLRSLRLEAFVRLIHFYVLNYDVFSHVFSRHTAFWAGLELRRHRG